jgi:hypothetical protein
VGETYLNPSWFDDPSSTLCGSPQSASVKEIIFWFIVSPQLARIAALSTYPIQRTFVIVLDFPTERFLL